jgi:hypothetical protein
MTARLYNRISRLLVYKPTGFFTHGGNAIEINDMRVSFSITKTLEKDPNNCIVTVSNLAQTTRAELQKKPLHVRLEAGYDGNLQRLFQGDVRYVRHIREETEWNTELHLGDGERAYRFARVNRSYNGGLKRSQAIKEIAREMGLPLAQNIDTIIGDSEFVSGLTLSGPANRELTRVLDPLGLKWSIQDGRLQLLRSNEDNEQEVIVSQDTGMIGSPEFGTPEQNGKTPSLTVRMLLYPGVTPGGLIRVQSQQINGTFKVEKVTHTGDTHGQDWTSEIEARPR